MTAWSQIPILYLLNVGRRMRASKPKSDLSNATISHLNIYSVNDNVKCEPLVFNITNKIQRQVFWQLSSNSLDNDDGEFNDYYDYGFHLVEFIDFIKHTYMLHVGNPDEAHQ